MAVRAPRTGFRHNGLTIFLPVAGISLPHSQIGASQLRNAVFLCPTFYPITLFRRQIPSFVHYNTIWVMSEGDVRAPREERGLKAVQGCGTVKVGCWGGG